MLFRKQRQYTGIYATIKNVHNWCGHLITQFHVEERSEYKEMKGRWHLEHTYKTREHILTILNTKRPPKAGYVKENLQSYQEVILFYFNRNHCHAVYSFLFCHIYWM